MGYLYLLKDEAARREVIRLCLHTMFFTVSWYFGLLKGFIILAVVCISGILCLVGMESTGRWVVGWIIPVAR